MLCARSDQGHGGRAASKRGRVGHALRRIGLDRIRYAMPAVGCLPPLICVGDLSPLKRREYKPVGQRLEVPADAARPVAWAFATPSGRGGILPPSRSPQREHAERSTVPRPRGRGRRRDGTGFRARRRERDASPLSSSTGRLEASAYLASVRALRVRLRRTQAVPGGLSRSLALVGTLLQ